MNQICEFSASDASPLAATPTHCVFRRGTSWLALPTMAVREVLPQPDMVAVPGTPAAFAGLCHVRGEFLPVLNLDAVLAERHEREPHILLVLDDRDGPWAIRVDEVMALQVLELSDAPERDGMDTGSVVAGWATHGDLVIQVLDQSCVRRMVEQALAEMWRPVRLAE
ncbi:MAG: chemotaxis protein CheW [Fuerstiella sp.]